GNGSGSGNGNGSGGNGGGGNRGGGDFARELAGGFAMRALGAQGAAGDAAEGGLVAKVDLGCDARVCEAGAGVEPPQQRRFGVAPHGGDRGGERAIQTASATRAAWLARRARQGRRAWSPAGAPRAARGRRVWSAACGSRASRGR